MFHITQPQSTSRHFPHPPLPHHTHIQHHISHHTIIYITLHHHILIKRHTTTLDITQPIASFSTSDITHATLFFTLKFHATTFHNTYATFHTIPYITCFGISVMSHVTSFHITLSEIATFHITPHFTYTWHHSPHHTIIHIKLLHHISAHHSTSRQHFTLHITTFKYKFHKPPYYTWHHCPTAHHIPNHSTPPTLHFNHRITPPCDV